MSKIKSKSHSELVSTTPTPLECLTFTVASWNVVEKSDVSLYLGIVMAH